MTSMTSAPAQNPAARPADPDAYPVLTVLMLMLGGFVLPIVGWLAGVVMLWAGKSWTPQQKWLGTLVWPAVVAVPAVVFAISGMSGGQPWLMITGVAVGVVIAVVALPWTFVRLMHPTRR